MHWWRLLIANSESLYINVISSGICTLLGFAVGAYPRMKAALHARRIRRVWSCGNRLVVFSGTRRMTEKDGTYVRSGDFYAVTEVMAFLRSQLTNVKPEITVFQTAGDFGALHDADVVLIGGPHNNEMTNRTLSELQKQGRLPFSLGKYFFDFGGGLTFTLEEGANGNIVKDYAVVLKRKSPFNEQRFVIVLMGLKSFGTFAAAQYVVRDQLYREVGDAGEFCVVVGAHVSDERLISFALESVVNRALASSGAPKTYVHS